MNLDWPIILLILGACMILVEVALGGFAGFDLVLTGSILVIAGAVGLWRHDTLLTLLVAGALGIAYVGVGRRWVRRRIRSKQVPSNIDALIGQTGVVTSRIEKHQPGRVKVLTEEWLALPAADAAGPFEEGTQVIVEAVDGVSVRVK